MGQECQQCNDTYDKINFDIFILKDKVRTVQKGIERLRGII